MLEDLLDFSTEAEERSFFRLSLNQQAMLSFPNVDDEEEYSRRVVALRKLLEREQNEFATTSGSDGV